MRMYWSYLFELMCVFLCVWKLVVFQTVHPCLLFQYILASLFTFGNVFVCHVPVSSPFTPWKSHTNLVCCCNRSCYFAVAAADAIIDGTLKHQSSADPLSHADGPTPLKNVFKNQNLSPLDTGYTPPKTNTWQWTISMFDIFLMEDTSSFMLVFFNCHVNFSGGGSCCGPVFLMDVSSLRISQHRGNLLQQCCITHSLTRSEATGFPSKHRL